MEVLGIHRVLLSARLDFGEHWFAEDLGFQLLRVQALQVPGVGQYLGHHRTARLGVTGQLHLDDDQAAGGLHGQQVRVAATQPDLAAQHRQPRRPGQWQHLWGLLNQGMQLCLRLIGGRLERTPLPVSTRAQIAVILGH
jgi:hypothetical protein